MSDEPDEQPKSRFVWEEGDVTIEPATDAGESGDSPSAAPVLSEHFQLPIDVEPIVLNLVADVIEHAASLGADRWGLTDYRPDLRVNVGWTEIITTSIDGIRLIVDGDLALKADPEEQIILEGGKDERGYYPSIRGSLLALLPYDPVEEFKRAIEVLHPALMKAIDISAKRPATPAIRRGHSDEALSALSEAVGRELSKPAAAARR